MNREELKKIMPHREPMLLIDEAECTGEGKGRGSYTVKGDEFFLQGHFPDNPVVPGVILCEMIAQSACVVLEDSLTDVTPYFTSLDSVKIRRTVVPGNKFETEVVMTKQKPPFYFFTGKGFVNGNLCISGEFGFAAVPNEVVAEKGK